MPITSRLLFRFRQELKASISKSSVIICEHPYLFLIPLSLSRGKILIYDAQNVEYDIKKDIYGNESLFGRLMVGYVKKPK